MTPHPIIADFKIKQRHGFLVETIGTKDEENISFNNSNNLMISVTACMLALSIMEFAAYILYNRKVSRFYYIATLLCA